MSTFNILGVGLIAGVLGALGSVYTDYQSLHIPHIWDMVKSQDYRYAYMVTKTNCIQTLKENSAYLKFDTDIKGIEVLCTNEGHNAGRKAYCSSDRGRESSLCEP